MPARSLIPEPAHQDTHESRHSRRRAGHSHFRGNHLRPKPMVEIGGKPILWHIMKIYSAHGINDFVICWATRAT